MTKINSFAKYLLLAVSAWYLLVYFYVVYYRIQYPFELDWIEGGLLGQVQRIVNGQVVYGAPSLEFVAFIYPPLYFYLSALLSQIFGVTFFSLRSVSLLASITSFAFIYLIVKEETRNKILAFVSACFFIATFRVTGAWMDIARVDSLFVTLLLVFTYFIRKDDSTRSFVFAGVFAALAILTKQTALIMCLPVIGCLLIRDWKRTLVLIVTASAIAGGVSLAFNLASNGWFAYYVFELLNYQTEWLPKSEFIRFWPRDLLAHATVALAFLIYYFYKTWRTQKGQLLGVIFLSVLTGTYISRMKLGGYDNVLLPLYAVMSILMGLGGHKVMETMREPNRVIKEAGFFLAIILQMTVVYYSPSQQIPTEADRQAGQEFVKHLSTLEGRIYLPDHPYLLVMAGKDSHAHNSAVWDVLRSQEENRGKAILEPELSEAIKNQAFAAIITDSQFDILPRLKKYYEIKDYVFGDNGYFYPVTGVRIRPSQIYLPRKLP